MDVDNLIAQLGQQRQQTGQQIADLPNVQDQLRQTIFGGSDPTTQSLVNNENDKVNQLYQHDKMLSQIYQPPPQQSQGQPPQSTQGPGVTQSVARATGLAGVDPSLIQNPFGAIQFGNTQDKDTLQELIDTTNQIKQRHDALGNALDAAVTAAQTKIESGKYQSDALQQQIDDMLKEQQINQAGSKYTASDINSQIIDYLGSVKDSYGHITPDQYMQAKTMYMVMGGKGTDFDTQFQDYRDPNNDKYSVDPQALTATEQKARQANKDALDATQNLLSTAQDIADRLKQANPAVRYLAGLIPGLGIQHIDPNIATAHDLIFQSLSDLRKKAVGGRITQAEIGWLTKNTLPSDTDTPDVMASKVQVLQDQLNKKLADPNFVIGSNKSAYTSSGGTTTLKAKSGKTYTVKVM